MVRLFLAISLLVMNTQARENPFFPSEGEEDLPYTSNKNQKKSKLKQLSLTLPSTARVIKKVTIHYENLDASSETKSIDLDNTVDWHLPIFISQSYVSEKAPATKGKTLVKANTAYIDAGKIKYAKFSLNNKSFKIITNDKLIRNFLLPQPHRIVMDFKRDSSIKTYIKDIPNSVFTKVRVGNHNAYYRVVVELDGYYRYKLKKLSDGCLITIE